MLGQICDFAKLAKEGEANYFSHYALSDALAQLTAGVGSVVASRVIGDWALLTLQ